MNSVTVASNLTTVTAELDLSGASQAQYLLRVVNPDRVISNLVPFDAVYMAPVLDAITPTTGTAPIPITITATGSRFTPESVCRVQSGGYTLALPTTFQSTVPPGTTLSCVLDTAAVPPGNVQLWVVNEGGLVSAQRTVTVAGALNATALSPPSAAAGTVVVVTVYGSGFASSSVVKANGVARPTTFLDPTRLQATIDLTAINPASCPCTSVSITVTSGASTTSPLSLGVVAAASAIQVNTLSPQSGYQGTSNVSLVLSGTGFPSNAVVQILPPSGPNAGTWQFLTPTTVNGTFTTATATLNLSDVPLGNAANWPAGDYEVRLYFPTPPATYSVTFPFRVLSNVPTLWSYTASPEEQQQGTNVMVTAKGTTFFTGIKLRLITPTGTRLSPNSDLTTIGPPDTLVATFSLSNLDTGIYQLVAFNTSSGDSNPLSFSVAPGQPTLASLSPATASQSSATPIVTITLIGTNFAKPDATGVGGSIVFIQNPGLDIPATPPPTIAVPVPVQPWMAIPSGSVNVVDPAHLEISLDLRDTVPSSATTCETYWVKVVNPPGGAGMETVPALAKSVCVRP